MSGLYLQILQNQVILPDKFNTKLSYEQNQNQIEIREV